MAWFVYSQIIPLFLTSQLKDPFRWVCSPPLHSADDKYSFYRVMGMAKHLTTYTGQMRQTAGYSHTYSLGEGTPHATQDHIGCAPAAWASKHCWKVFVVARGWGAPGSHGRMRLASLNNSVGWQGTEAHYFRTSRHCARSLWWRLFGWGTVSMVAEFRGGPALRPFEALPVSPAVKAAHDTGS